MKIIKNDKSDLLVKRVSKTIRNKDIMKITKNDKSDLLVKRVSKTIRNEAKETMVWIS